MGKAGIIRRHVGGFGVLALALVNTVGRLLFAQVDTKEFPKEQDVNLLNQVASKAAWN